MARWLFLVFVGCYALVILPFASYMQQRPVTVKLGYFPDAEVLKTVVADHRNLVAQAAVVKVLFYYGTLVEKLQNKIVLPPEYFNMFKTLQTAAKLDPYNMDTYYFTQAAFTWEIKRIKEVNDLLGYGMKYRTWDYQLPFFIGFNSAYFLKDYKTAAGYMQKAAELSGEPLYATLAARYFYESGQNDLGIIFMNTMQRGARDKNEKAIYELRKKALIAVKKIQDALERYMKINNKLPKDLSELVAAGYINVIPDDPYGGAFYISETGMVQTTSKFAFPRGKLLK